MIDYTHIVYDPNLGKRRNYHLRPDITEKVDKPSQNSLESLSHSYNSTPDEEQTQRETNSSQPLNFFTAYLNKIIYSFYNRRE